MPVYVNMQINKNLPQYPDFKVLEMSDKIFFDSIFKQINPEISEYTFSNLISWNDYYHFQYSALNNIVLVMINKNKENLFFSPIGNVTDCFDVIEKITAVDNSKFIRVSEDIAAYFKDKSNYNVELDLDNSDYVYLTDDLMYLHGVKYDGKRNLIKNFKTKFQYEYVSDCYDMIKDCLDFEELWCVEKDCQHVESLKNEKKAVEVMLNNIKEFEIIAGGLKIDNKLAAICLAQRLNKDTLVLHVLKAMRSFSGLYQTMLNEFIIHEARDFKFVNMEQDLGVEGLRKAKQAYHPCKMINKYNLSIK